MLPIIKKLTDTEFQNTFSSPMRFLTKIEESSGISIKYYLQNVIKKEKLNTTIEDIEIHFVYHTPDEKYEHILFYYGVKELYMVIVNDLGTREILGYNMLDLIEKYDL